MITAWIIAGTLTWMWLLAQWQIRRLTVDLAEWKARAEARAGEIARYHDRYLDLLRRRAGG